MYPGDANRGCPDSSARDLSDISAAAALATHQEPAKASIEIVVDLDFYCGILPHPTFDLNQREPPVMHSRGMRPDDKIRGVSGSACKTKGDGFSRPLAHPQA